MIKIDGKTFVSDNAGKAKFSLIFNESNYIEPKKLEVFEGENLISQKGIDFFTETPIIIIKNCMIFKNQDNRNGPGLLCHTLYNVSSIKEVLSDSEGFG